jgi:hypothetical protein
MRWLEQFRMAVLMLFRRKAQSARLNDELTFHLDQQVKENIARGMAPEEARYAALRTFGNPTQLRDEARSSWSWNWLEKILRDLHYGVRTLTRSPGFSLTAILVMALGIGATTSLFTIVRSVLLKPLPFSDPDNLVMVYEHFRNSTGGDGFNVVSPADFNDWRNQTHGFEDMAAWHEYGFDLTGEHQELPEVVQATSGSWNLFRLLGTPMALGRTFRPEEDQVDANHVVILSWSLFQRRFAGDPSVIGKQIRLDSAPYQVIGVLPRWFTYPDARTQLWVPYASTFDPKAFARHDMHQSHVVARLRPGTSAAAALNEVGALQYRIHLAHAAEPVAEEVRLRPILNDVTLDVKTPLVVLLCAVGCMLLIACLNVSNLLVARSAARRKELAVRGALGGSRLMLIGEQMAESLLICAAGGTLGLLLSFVSTRWLADHWSALPRADAIHLDATVLAFSIGLVFLTAMLSGPLTGDFLDWRGHLRRAAGIIPVDWRQPVTRYAAQNVAHGGNRAHCNSACLSGPAIQKLFASAHGQFGLCHGSRAHHEVWVTGEAIRHPGESRRLPRISAGTRAPVAGGQGSRTRIYSARSRL